MTEIVDKINKLIEQGNAFNWEECSKAVVGHGPNGVYGKEPSASWQSWTSRIKLLLQRSVKESSEPFIYFNNANSVRIEGFYKDHFDAAKDGYIGALKSLKGLIEEGDVFNELLISDTPKKNLKEKQDEKRVNSSINKNKVFIVHGHDHNLKIELEVFLSHIGLKPIVLHRQADEGKTIIEKFESNSDVAYVFVLLTPDEIAYTADQMKLADSKRKKEFRARPNVIFEFGFFAGKLGRDKVCALHKGNVTIPSDLSGFIYKKVDTTIEDIGFALIKELKAAGLTIEI